MLDLAEVSLLVHLFDEQELTGIDDCFGHHVFQAGLLDEVADLLAFFDGGSHWDGAHDVLARFQGFDRHPAMIGNWRVDMYEVNLRILQDVGKLRVALFDLELVTDRFQLFRIALADRVDSSIRMPLIDGNELGAKPQTDDRDVDLPGAHVILPGVRDGQFKGLWATFSQGSSTDSGSSRSVSPSPEENRVTVLGFSVTG